MRHVYTLVSLRTNVKLFIITFSSLVGDGFNCIILIICAICDIVVVDCQVKSNLFLNTDS